jgi:MATE family multidrug resistance protein
VNLYNVLLFTGVGLSVAISPVIAAAIGRRVDAIHDTRRSFRWGCGVVTLYAVPATLLLSFAEAIFLSFGQDAELRGWQGVWARSLQWALWPTLLGYTCPQPADRAWQGLGAFCWLGPAALA